MQTTEETHRYFRHTLSLTVWHKLGLPDPNCCMIPLCWCVAVVSGGHDSLIEVGVIKMQWENWAAYSDDGTLGSGVPWSFLGYTVQWTVMEINVHWEEGLSDQSKQQWLFPKVAGRGEGKMLYGLWLIPLWEHRAHLLGHFKKIFNCGKNPRNMADTWNIPTWHPSTMRFIKTHMHTTLSPPYSCQIWIEVWCKVTGFLRQLHWNIQKL